MAEAGRRPDIDDLSGAEQIQLRDLILEFACNPQPTIPGGVSGNQHHVNNMQNAHTQGNGGACVGINFNPNFLPFHRTFTELLEDFLIDQGFPNFVPLPAWDPCKPIPSAFFGSGTACSGLTAPSGPNSTCAGFDGNKYSCENLCNGFDDFRDFSLQLECDHNFVHGSVGSQNKGAFGTMQSAGTALFYIWHAYVDDIWYSYQVANMTDDLPLDIIAAKKSACGLNKYQLPKVCCLEEVEWSVDGAVITDVVTSQTAGFFNFEFNVEMGCDFTVLAEVTSTCSNSKTISLEVSNPSCQITAAASLTDENGNTITEVCFGEDFYFDASGSSNYDEYFISIWEKDANGNNLNYARFDDPKWRTGPVPSSFNMSAEIANGNWAYTTNHPNQWAFCPGGNYEIQFAVRNACIGWKAVVLKVDVEVCSEPEIEIVDESCGTATIRVKFSENWVLDGPFWSASAPGTITDTYYQGGYYYAVVTSPITGNITVDFFVETNCGGLGVGTNVHICGEPPVLPDVPPVDLDYVCFDEGFDKYCYDFKNTECVIGFEVYSDHPKLTAEAFGTTVCLYVLWQGSFTANLFITPIGDCGPGLTQIWPIHVNSPEHCEGINDWDEIPLIANPNKDLDTNAESMEFNKNKTSLDFMDQTGLTIYPNPFKEVLEFRSSDNTEGLLMKIFNATGKIVFETDDLNNPINTGQFVPGMYFTQILDNNGQIIHTEKLIKSN